MAHGRFLGSPHAGGYDCKKIADRLYSVYPDVKIIIIIREQTSIIRYFYLNYLRAGGMCDLADYINPNSTSMRLPRFDLNYFEYDRTISYCCKLFGPEHILVHTYEMLRDDKIGFYNKFLVLAGLDPNMLCKDSPASNQGMSPQVLKLKRFINPFIQRDMINGYSPFVIPAPVMNFIETAMRRIDTLISVENKKITIRKLEDEIHEYTVGIHAESNQLTSELISIDLSQLGNKC